MEFSLEKCAMLIMKSRKRQMVEGIELPNQGKIGTLGEKETCQFLRILETDTIQPGEMNEKFFKKSILGEGKNNSKPKIIYQ